MGGQGSVPCLPACAYMPTISPSLASTRQTRHADGTAAWWQQGLSCRCLVYDYSGSVNQWAGWWVDAVQWRIWSAESVGSDVRCWATNGQRGGVVSASEEAKEGSVTVCVLLLWLGSRTVSHVAWALTEHCRLEPTCAEQGDWRAAWCGTRRIRHYTATGKFTRQASRRTGRLNEITSSRSSQARETAAFNSTTPLRWRHQLRIPNGAADKFGAAEE